MSQNTRKKSQSKKNVFEKLSESDKRDDQSRRGNHAKEYCQPFHRFSQPRSANMRGNQMARPRWFPPPQHYYTGPPPPMPSTSSSVILTQEQFEELTRGYQALATNDKESNFKKESKDRNKTKTVLSTDIEGNVQEPEICVFALGKTCKFSNCRKLHAKCPLQWQFGTEGKWYNFRGFHSKELEDAYKNPDIDEVELTQMNPNIGNLSEQMIELLTTEKLIVNFDSMKVNSHDTESVSYDIRRISTYSSVLTSNKMATLWEWYFKDELDKWVKYGNVDSLNKINCVVDISSHDIETKFTKEKLKEFGFSSTNHTYTMDLINMKQKNTATGVERPVRRRPHFVPLASGSEMNALPKHWTKMEASRIFQQVEVNCSQQEYKDIEQLMHMTLPNSTIVNVHRNQNPGLWKAYINGKDIMMKKNKTTDPNEKRLFHGTSAENVNSILERNLDWRLHGLHGQKYGRGTYFASNASYSDNYAPVDKQSNKRILIAKVLVGTFTQGKSSLIRPPNNMSLQNMYDTTVNDVRSPSVFVKYDTQDYYPEYVVTYRM